MAKKRHNKDLPRKTDPAEFGGGRRRGYYSVADMARLEMLCSRAGCDRVAVHTWAACADGNTLRPACPECDYLMNAQVLAWWGDPDIDAKLAAYRARVEAEIGRPLEV